MFIIFLPFILRAYDAFDMLWSFLNYFAVCLTDGDYLNDWATHLPTDVAHAIVIVGHWLVNLT